MPIADDRLRLIFTCCHPALPMDGRVALTLRTLGGLTTPEIARAFLVPEPTLAQRLVRAKRKIRDAGIPYRVPAAELLPERLDGVLQVLYLVFNEGYAASSGDALVRRELCARGDPPGPASCVSLLPDEPEACRTAGPDAAARRPPGGPGRAPTGSSILLEDQDRSRWDAAPIAEGRALVERALAAGRPGPYQLQAADRRPPRRGGDRGRHGLGPDRRAVHGARADGPVPGRRTSTSRSRWRWPTGPRSASR